MTDPTQVPDINRLCEHDEEGTAGCRRTMTMLALEAEYDTFVHPEMYWGSWDDFCLHEGHAYYEKEFLNRYISGEEGVDGDAEPKVAELYSLLGHRLDTLNTSIDAIRTLLTSNIGGVPDLTSESPQFFQCEDVGKTRINIDDLDRELLDKIQSTFTNDVNPLLSNLADCLQILDDKIFCTRLYYFLENPAHKMGVLMIPTNTEKYVTGQPYFFPFKPLTDDEKRIVELLGDIDTEGQAAKTIIIDL